MLLDNNRCVDLTALLGAASTDLVCVTLGKDRG
jgi:hypothetical protein